MAERELVDVICTVDTKKLNAEVKLVVGCTKDEMMFIERFFNTDLHSEWPLVNRDDRV